MFYIRTQDNPEIGTHSSHQITAVDGILYIHETAPGKGEYSIFLDSPLCLVKLGIYPSLERAQDVFEEISDSINSESRYYEMPAKNLRTVRVQSVK